MSLTGAALVREIDRLIDNINPRAKIPRGFALWSEKMQLYWLQQNQQGAGATPRAKAKVMP